MHNVYAVTVYFNGEHDSRKSAVARQKLLAGRVIFNTTSNVISEPITSVFTTGLHSTALLASTQNLDVFAIGVTFGGNGSGPVNQIL